MTYEIEIREETISPSPKRLKRPKRLKYLKFRLSLSHPHGYGDGDEQEKATARAVPAAKLGKTPEPGKHIRMPPPRNQQLEDQIRRLISSKNPSFEEPQSPVENSG